MNATLQDTSTQVLEWRDGQPYSTQFKDIYFSSDDGLAETNYVFLQGNDLPKRFQQLGPQLNPTEFTIIETGFGTGLNFLCVAKLWLELAPINASLHFISTEKYPLSLPDMTSAHSLWPELNVLSQEFLLTYQTLFDTEKSVSLFNGRVQLTLLMGDANISLNDLTTKDLTDKNSTLKADAWFLDGFAPAKNPDMWQAGLFSQMAKLSTLGTTFATFTSAGIVRRGLQGVGFKVNKKAGFGKKREMLIGQFEGVNHYEPSSS